MVVTILWLLLYQETVQNENRTRNRLQMACQLA